MVRGLPPEYGHEYGGGQPQGMSRFRFQNTEFSKRPFSGTEGYASRTARPGLRVSDLVCNLNSSPYLLTSFYIASKPPEL